MGTVSQVTPVGAVSTFATGFSYPEGLAFDASGNLYVANDGNNSVSEVAPVPATNSVTIRSSVESDPMEIGGTNNSAVAGINITSAELAQIVTTASGTVTFGDANQTGNITFAGATAATTAGATTVALQSGTGAGGIVLDDTNGTALNGNGGTINLTAGTGGITALNSNNAIAEIATTGASVALNTTGVIGSAANRIQFANDANTAQQVVTVGLAPSAVYLDGLGSLTLGSIDGGGTSAPVNVTARTNLVVASGATINSGTSALTLGADLTAAGAGDNGIGTLTISAGANVYGANITLRGADEDIAPTAHVGSAAASSFSTFATGLSEPIALAFDASGNLYVANYGNGTVSKVTPGGVASTFATGFSTPEGLAFDASGNLYVANYGGGTVSKVTPGGTVTTFASGFAQPIGLAFDASGNLYVANAGTASVSKVTPGGVVTTFVSGLSSPAGLAFDASGNLYVADYGGTTVSQVTPGGTVSTFATGLHSPFDLAFDTSGNLYVANASGGTVSKVTPGGAVTTFATGFSGSYGLAFDAAGNLYVANLNNGIVSEVAPIPATTSVTIRSSVESDPMEIGGTNNSAVAGINITSAELAQIVTTASGTVTFGDTNQTGNITFAGATTTATTAGANTVALQSGTGAGGIVLDDTLGTALNGNAGTIDLTAGTGGITALNANDATAEIATTGAGVTLNTTGIIGSAANRIQFADDANTAQQVVTVGATLAPSAVYLDGLGSLTLGSIAGSTANTLVDATARTNLVVASGATITTGTSALTLGADLNADETGNDGVGTLTISAGASLDGTNITLRGADEDIASTATVGSALDTTSVTIRSSVESDPMEIGGTNNSAVAGINITSAELAQIVTTASGTVTFGDTNQTGNITFAGATTTATTAGANTVALQSGTGAGGIVLDDTLGTALNGNAGTIDLTAGTGGITALNANDATAEIATTGAGVTLNTTGIIGSAANRIQFADDANTAQQVVTVGATLAPSAVYLDGLGSLTLGSVAGGTANAPVNVTARGNLVVASGATINSGTSALTLGADLSAAGAGDNGVGTLTIDGNLYGANITLRGADEDIAPTAHVGSATPSAVSPFASGFSEPAALAFDAAGNLYVANYGTGTVDKVTPGGVVSTFASGFSAPAALAFDASGNLYVANSGSINTVDKVTPGGVVSTFATGLNVPFGLAFGASGNLYVSNYGSNAVSKVTPSGVVSTFATGFSEPAGLAFDASGNLYVADYGGTTVSKVTPTGVVSTFASGFSVPFGLAFDANGNLYVANRGSSTVSQVTPGGAVSTFATGFSSPGGLAFAASGNLYVANFTGNTVSEATPIPATASVTIQSSVESRPMEIGGTNNSAVLGINITSAELARIITTASGTITFGDTNQTGNITFVGAHDGHHRGASTDVVQAIAGPGQIAFDNINGIALNGHGGLVTLTPGTGELSGLLATTAALIASNGFTAAGLTLNLALGAAPTSGVPLTLVADTGVPSRGASRTWYLGAPRA